MTHSPSKILQQYLLDEGAVSVTQGAEWRSFLGWTPDKGSHDNCVTLYDTDGVKDGRLFRGGTNILHPGLQIMVRSTDYETAHAKAQAIAALLEACFNTEVRVAGVPALSRYYIRNASQQSPVLYLGLEEQGQRRFLFTINYLTTLSGEELVLTGLLDVVAHSAASTDLSADAMEGQIHYTVAATTVNLNLPPATVGLSAWFVQQGTGELQVNPEDDELFIYTSEELAEGQKMLLQNALFGTALSAIYVVCLVAGVWSILAQMGTTNPE